jgi:hypothetical protein
MAAAWKIWKNTIKCEEIRKNTKKYGKYGKIKSMKKYEKIYFYLNIRTPKS